MSKTREGRLLASTLLLLCVFIFAFVQYKKLNYAFCALPNSRILPTTVVLIASRAGAKNLRGS